MKKIIMLGLFIGLAGCQMTPQEAEAWRRAGDAAGDGSQTLQGMNQPKPWMQPVGSTSEQCHVTDLGGGNYRRDCN